MIDIFKENMVKKILIIMMIVIFSVMVSSGSVLIESTKVEAAKKDKKKPTVKIKGNKNISADVGKKVIIPKIIYSDNKTKKSKLKVGVTVKKGNKNYKTIANKIKKATVKNKSTSVIFEEEGTYKITYTITDLAKNKSIAVRYVMVSKDDGIQKEEYLIGNNILIVRFTNETENDIGLTVHISYKDEQYEGDSGFSQQYLPVGKSFMKIAKVKFLAMMSCNMVVVEILNQLLKNQHTSMINMRLYEQKCDYDISICNCVKLF